MPELVNPKHEAFATALASGECAASAYLAAGYRAKNRKAASASASRLLASPTVLARTMELKSRIDAVRQEETIKQIGVEKANAETKLVHDLVENDVRTRLGRVAAKIDRLNALHDVVRERAVYLDHQDVPGGKSGYVLTSAKTVAGKPFLTHGIDGDLLRELREIENEIAEELGQRIERSQKVPLTVAEIENLPNFPDLIAAYIEEGKALIDAEAEQAS